MCGDAQRLLGIAIALVVSTCVVVGGGGTSQQPPAQPDFGLSLSVSSVTLTQGSSNISFTVPVTPKMAFPGLFK